MISATTAPTSLLVSTQQPKPILIGFNIIFAFALEDLNTILQKAIEIVYTSLQMTLVVFMGMLATAVLYMLLLRAFGVLAAL